MLLYEGRDPQFVFAPRRHLGVSRIIFLRVFCVLSECGEEGKWSPRSFLGLRFPYSCLHRGVWSYPASSPLSSGRRVPCPLTSAAQCSHCPVSLQPIQTLMCSATGQPYLPPRRWGRWVGGRLGRGTDL